MSYLKEAIGGFLIEFGTRYDYIVGKWFIHGTIRVPTDGTFTLSATDGVNSMAQYTLISHPTMNNVVKTPTDEVSGVCVTVDNFYTNVVGIDASMDTSDTVLIPDLILTLTPSVGDPFVLTSVANTCLYGSGLDDWSNVSIGASTELAAQLGNGVWWRTNGTPQLLAWDNGTSTPNLRFQTHMTWPNYPGFAGVTVLLFYTLNLLGKRCSGYAKYSYGAGAQVSKSGVCALFNPGPVFTYYTGGLETGSKTTAKCSTQRRLSWEFTPADYTVAAATSYNAATKA